MRVLWGCGPSPIVNGGKGGFLAGRLEGGGAAERLQRDGEFEAREGLALPGVRYPILKLLKALVEQTIFNVSAHFTH